MTIGQLPANALAEIRTIRNQSGDFVTESSGVRTSPRETQPVTDQSNQQGLREEPLQQRLERLREQQALRQEERAQAQQQARERLQERIDEQVSNREERQQERAERTDSRVENRRERVQEQIEQRETRQAERTENIEEQERTREERVREQIEQREDRQEERVERREEEEQRRETRIREEIEAREQRQRELAEEIREREEIQQRQREADLEQQELNAERRAEAEQQEQINEEADARAEVRADFVSPYANTLATQTNPTLQQQQALAEAEQEEARLAALRAENPVEVDTTEELIEVLREEAEVLQNLIDAQNALAEESGAEDWNSELRTVQDELQQEVARDARRLQNGQPASARLGNFIDAIS